MSEPFAVEDSAIFFLVEETARVHPTVTFLKRRGLTVEAYADIKEFLLAATEHHPQFLAISVNHHNPKVFELIEVLGTQLSCDVIVFAEKPDRRSLPLIRRAKQAHKLLGSMSGPSVLLKMRKIARKKLSPPTPAGGIILETLESSNKYQPSTEHFLITDGKAHNDLTFTTDTRRRGDGPSVFKGPKHEKGPLIWQEGAGRGTGPAYMGSLGPPTDTSSKKSGPAQVEVSSDTYKEVAQWIEAGLNNSVQKGDSAPLPFPTNTKKLAIVQIRDATGPGYLVLACSSETDLKGNFLKDLHKNLKDLKSLPQGPQWESFRLLDVDVGDVQNWLRDSTQARVLGRHQNSEVMASFLASSAEIPKLVEALKDHYSISIADLIPGNPMDYDTFLNMKLNDKLIQYVARGGHFSQKQLDRIALLHGSPLVIKKEDVALFESQFLRDNILQLGSKIQKKKAA